jgi:hypothetical protein
VVHFPLVVWCVQYPLPVQANFVKYQFYMVWKEAFLLRLKTIYLCWSLSSMDSTLIDDFCHIKGSWNTYFSSTKWFFGMLKNILIYLVDLYLNIYFIISENMTLLLVFAYNWNFFQGSTVWCSLTSKNVLYQFCLTQITENDSCLVSIDIPIFLYIRTIALQGINISYLLLHTICFYMGVLFHGPV